MTTTFHRYMLVAALASSALAFKMASACLSWAAYHKRSYNLAMDKRVEKLMPEFVGKRSPVAHRTITSKNQWTDAEPERCSLCDEYGECEDCEDLVIERQQSKAAYLKAEAARRGIRVVDYPEK